MFVDMESSCRCILKGKNHGAEKQRLSLQVCLHMQDSKVCSGPSLASRPFPCDLTAKNGFHIFKWLTKYEKEEYHFGTHENDTKFKLQCPLIKFYWNTATHVRVCLICGCFPGATTTSLAVPGERDETFRTVASCRLENRLDAEAGGIVAGCVFDLFFRN